MFINTAGMLPPKLPPVKIAVRNNIACMKSMYTVMGRKMAIAIDICSPGMAPNTRPIKMPGITMSQQLGTTLLRSMT